MIWSLETQEMRQPNKVLIMPEGFELKFYERESVKVTLNIPKDVLKTLQEIADKKDMSVESVLKFFIGQGLRKELDPQSAKELMRKRLKSRKNIEESADVDLAA